MINLNDHKKSDTAKDLETLITQFPTMSAAVVVLAMPNGQLSITNMGFRPPELAFVSLLIQQNALKPPRKMEPPIDANPS